MASYGTLPPTGLGISTPIYLAAALLIGVGSVLMAAGRKAKSAVRR